jgi:hypothetical protein
MIGMNGNTKHLMFGLCVVIALLGAFMGCASAVFNPEGYMGTVIGKDADNNTFEVQTTQEWVDGGWQLNDTPIEWLFPNEDAVNEICVGDYVEVLGCAASPGEVIGLGKMNPSTEMFITDIYGDPTFLEPYWSSEPPDPPLLGNYTVKYNNTPNCSNCDMCNCEASYTNVTITNGTGQVEVDDYQLYPGQSYTYEGTKYHVNITFHSGEAPACPVCNDTCPPGPQPISDFTIHISEDPIARYDANCNGYIDRDELKTAILDYLTSPIGTVISRDDLKTLILDYLTHLP